MRIKTEKRRSAILQAASRAFERRGYEASGMAGIAAELGGAKATIYSYFPSKEALRLAVLQSAAEEHYLAVFTGLRAGGALAPQLQAFGRRYLEVMTRADVIALLRLALQDADRSETGRLFYRCGPEAGWRRVAEFLAQAMQVGQLQRADPWVAARHLRALLAGEWLEERLLGVSPALDEHQREACLARALAVFLRGYAA